MRSSTWTWWTHAGVLLGPLSAPQDRRPEFGFSLFRPPRVKRTHERGRGGYGHADGLSETQKLDVRALICDVKHHKAALDVVVAARGGVVPALAQALLTPAAAHSFGYYTCAPVMEGELREIG